MWKHLSQRRSAFADLVAGKSLALVGNGGNQLGTGSGKRIDQADLVVRFNNFQLGLEYQADYGKRVDIWVNSLCRDVLYQTERADYLVCPLPLLHWRWLHRYNATSKKALLKAIRAGGVFRDAASFQPLIETVPNPSTGLSFLHWLSTLDRAPSEVELFGFSFFDKAVPHHYFDQDVRCGHDGSVEAKYARQLLDNWGR